MSKVVIIEDDQTMRSLLNTLLDMEGYSVVLPAMETLDSIFAAIQIEQPDLILLDVNLHNASGFDLIKRIKANNSLIRTRILMSSGFDYREECLAAGADGFLLKPYLPGDLIQLIHKILIPDSDREVEG